MIRISAKYFLIILFFFAVAFCSGKETYPDQSSQPVTKEACSFREQQVPNTELERVHQPAAAGGQIAVQKNVVCSDLLSVAVFHQPGIAAENSIIKASSLLVKDHLSHNYPSHNFW